MQTASTCPSCQGQGKSIDKRPKGTDANGMLKKEELVSINIPAGVEEGMQLKVSGKGNAAPFDGVPGDLLVIIQVEEHTNLKREGKTYISIVILIWLMLLWDQVKKSLRLMEKVKVKIEQGTQSGKDPSS